MVEIENVTFRYHSGEDRSNGLHDISLTIKKGEFVVLCGKSGCGKTTLTRLINGLIPHYYEGDFSGGVRIAGEEVHTQPLTQTSRLVGSVFQNPRSQFFNVDTTSELAFGCENLALPAEDIMERIGIAAEAFQLEDLLDRSIFELSGGEKQRIACASVYAVQPEVFVLDEPSSNLDTESTRQLGQVLQKLKAAGKTVIISEHRLHYLAELADRFVYLEDGAIAKEYTLQGLLALTPAALADLGLRSLHFSDLAYHDTPLVQAENSHQITIEGLTCKHQEKTVLDIPSLRIAYGEIVAVIGHNGAGKSTFAGCLCGVIKHKGSICFMGKSRKPKGRVAKSYMVMQDVNHQLFTESVTDELTLNVPEDRKRIAGDVLHATHLTEYAQTHPLALSGGQKQRVAIGSAVCAGKEILIYDEPTSGQDYENMRATCGLIRTAAEDALLSLVITHDLEFILNCCTSVLHLHGGKLSDYYALDAQGAEKLKQSFSCS